MAPRDVVAEARAALGRPRPVRRTDIERESSPVHLVGEYGPDRFRFYTDLELAELPPLTPIIGAKADADPDTDAVLFRDTLAVIRARWESYKTFVALLMGFCMATGAEWCGRRVKHGAVIYLSAEGGAGLHKRMRALRAQHGGIADTIPMILHPGAVLVDDPTELAAAFLAAEAKLQEIGFGHLDILAVFIDTLARNMRGDENKAIDMGAVIRGGDWIRRQTGACVVFVHHEGWTEGKGRGSTNLPASVDTEISLTRDDDTVTLKCEKQKDGPHFPDIRLEAFPIAGSLAFRSVVPTSAKLTKNEALALSVVQNAGPLSSTDWMHKTDLVKSSYNNARKRLMALAYVKLTKAGYAATEAGSQAAGTKNNSGTSAEQTDSVTEVHPLPMSKDMGVVPDLGFESDPR